MHKTFMRFKRHVGWRAILPGAVIVAADGAMLCSPDFAWVDTKKSPVGCLRYGQLSAVGTIAKGESKDSTQTECRPDGTWERVD